MPITLRCHPGIGPRVTGTALVAKDNFSARYDLDRDKGIFYRPSHKLAWQSYVDRILVLNRGTLIAQGPPAEVRANKQVQAIYLGEGLVYDASHRAGASA